MYTGCNAGFDPADNVIEHLFEFLRKLQMQKEHHNSLFSCYRNQCASSVNSQKIETDRFYDHIWPFLCQLSVNLSQNRDPDRHFELLKDSKS